MRCVVILELALLGAVVFSSTGATKAAAQDQRVTQQQATLLGPTKFDGTYTVDVITQDGSCGRTQVTMRVVDGQIASVSPNNANISVSGLIEDTGVVSMTFRGGENDVAHVGGMVKGRSGKGAWSSPTLLCGGVWRADKQQ
jgi:hypothetical protein